jgi:hypothetical protein
MTALNTSATDRAVDVRDTDAAEFLYVAIEASFGTVAHMLALGRWTATHAALPAGVTLSGAR